MERKQYDAVLFDLDGTLTRSEAGITRSAMYAAEKMGFTGFTQEQFLPFIGPPLYESFQKVVGMSEAQAEQATVYYRERFSAVGWSENEVYEGIPHLLRSLKLNGVRIALATAKPQVFAERIVRHFGLEPFLDAIVGPGFDNKHASKADIVKKAMEQFGGRIVMVGDRRFDIEGGRANGVDTIGVTYGSGSEQELTDDGATQIARSVEELTQMLIGEGRRAPGVLITLEGMDGCGKTTQRTALEAYLKQMGWQVKTTREPGGDEVAEKIRALLLDPDNAALCDEAEAYLYAASRAQNVRAVIRPALAEGCAVVCDRYVHSSVAYQGGGRQLGVETVCALNETAVGGTKPDIIVYLRMEPDKALARRLSASGPDRLEMQAAEFFARTFDGYERVFAGDDSVLTVDASAGVEDVTRQMTEGLRERLGRMPAYEMNEQTGKER